MIIGKIGIKEKKETLTHTIIFFFFFLLTRIIYFFHCRKRRMYLNSWTALYSYIYIHIYTITYNPQLNVTHKFIID